MNDFNWYVLRSGHHLVPPSFDEHDVRPLDPALDHHDVPEGSEPETRESKPDVRKYGAKLWLKPLHPLAQDWEQYAPLQRTALFRTFGDLYRHSSESIVAFANQFGLLTHPQQGEPIGLWGTGNRTNAKCCGLLEQYHDCNTSG